ncbi:MAG TPA: hypothetical protein VN936_01375, partial [Candidatus Acidoferrum sp.]|nr:hypothetical protein [Candidatus Acidoferrum sp.]
MKQRLGIFMGFAAACALAACAGNAGSTGSQAGNAFTLPLGHDLVMQAKMPKNFIGEELPSEGVGTVDDPTWGKVGGFTQTMKAQVMAFPPGTKLTIKNLSKSIPHT